MRAGVSDVIADRRCWSNGYGVFLPMHDCWILVVEEARMRSTWVGVDIVWWVWIGRRPCSLRDDVDIVHCRWFTPISVTFPFT